MQYANNYETYGIDFNNNMVEVAQQKNVMVKNTLNS
jgi:ubiquinone/menaquinone biosynthesis C-methylase UbiE